MVDDFNELKYRAEQLFIKNTRHENDHTFVVPSGDTYPAQFAWDSGFHSISSKYFDPDLSKKELLSLLSRQQQDGRIPHETSIVQGSGMNMQRLAAKYFLGKCFNRNTSYLIDPPVYVYAVWDFFKYTGDKEFLSKCYPYLIKLISYLETRDGFGDGLISIVHPLESGTDASPAFDDPLSYKKIAFIDSISYFQKMISLINFNFKYGWDFNMLKEKGRFILEDVLFNTIYIKALESMQYISLELEDIASSKYYADRVVNLTDKMEEILWDKDDEIFYPRYNPVSPKFSKIKTLSNLSPIFLSRISRDKVNAMIERYLISENDFWTPFKLSFNNLMDIDDTESRFMRKFLWRGKVVWNNINWMLVHGLILHDYKNLAVHITQNCVDMVLKNGFREYYSAFTGKGNGARDFTWSALTLDMIEISSLL